MTLEEIKMESGHKFTAASKYIEAIRSKAKREYARSYYQHLRCPVELRGGSPKYPPELPYMAAQAVRMNLDEIMEGNIP